MNFEFDDYNFTPEEEQMISEYADLMEELNISWEETLKRIRKILIEEEEHNG